MMDLGEPDPLSARSTSSIEDGASSARSKKSKTLARLRKLKKSESSPRDPTKDGLIPHPPESQLGDDTSNRRLSNGFVNGGSELHGDLLESTTIGGDKIAETKDIMSGIDKTKLSSIDSLPSNRLDWGEKSPLKSSLFPSPLDPVKPRRGLGGLEPLAPRTVLEPVQKPKLKSQLEAEDTIDRLKMGTSGLKNGHTEVNETAKELGSNHLKGDVLKIDGVVETESSDSLDLLPNRNSVQEVDSLRLSTVEETEPQVSLHEMPTSVHKREHTKDDFSKSEEALTDSENDDDALDILPDNGASSKHTSDVLVSSAMTKRIDTSRTLDEVTNTRKLSEGGDISVRNQLQNSLVGDLDNVIKQHWTKPEPIVTQIEEDGDDESDDELIVVSPLPNRIKSQTQANVLPPQCEEIPVVDDVMKEDELLNRTLQGGSDHEEEAVQNDSKEDEENLKKYLRDKLNQIEDDEDSDVVVPTSPSSSLRAGRLSPITNASVPPPLPNTVMSPSLRTMYKRDDDIEDSFGNSEVSDAVLSGGSLSETNRSMASSSLLLNTLTNKGARRGNRSYLSGGVRNTGSLVGKDELDSHIPERRLRIFVATWNMHEDKEIPENLDDLLLPEDIEYMQDVYVIGTQESTPDITEWEIRLQETLGPSHVLLHSASHGVLQCVVFIRRDLIWFCSPVEESRVSTRPGSMIKTKGAIAVSFNFFGTSFIFIVSHFTSGDENMKERLLDYEKTLKGISLPDKVPPTRKFNILTSDVTTRFDCVFWCGDFNFRLAENKARVEGWIDQLKRGSKDDYNILLQHDQLSKAMQRNEIFKGFQEGKIQFLPTYKYDCGEDVYDTSPKARVPSYTDRVLYKSRKVADISLIHYSSCDEIKTSDHRPVYAVFEASIRPGKDNSIMGGGMFVRQVYIEGIKRRVAKAGMSKRTQAGSAVCSVM